MLSLYIWRTCFCKHISFTNFDFVKVFDELDFIKLIFLLTEVSHFDELKFVNVFDEYEFVILTKSGLRV